MTDRMGVEVGRQLEKRDLGGEGGEELEMGRGRPKRKARLKRGGSSARLSGSLAG